MSYLILVLEWSKTLATISFVLLWIIAFYRLYVNHKFGEW